MGTVMRPRAEWPGHIDASNRKKKKNCSKVLIRREGGSGGRG